MINKEVAFGLYKNKIKDFNKDNLINEIKKIFHNQTNNKIKEILMDNNIDYLSLIGIDNNLFNDVINKIDSGDYYITRKEDTSCGYYGSGDYTFYDTFNIVPILKEAYDYCYCLYKINDYCKLCDIGLKLINSVISFMDIDDYGNQWYDGDCYSVDEVFYYLDVNVDYNDFLKLVFSAMINMKCDYEDLVNVLRKLSLYDIRSFNEILIYVKNKDNINNIVLNILNTFNKLYQDDSYLLSLFIIILLSVKCLDNLF